MEQTAEVQEITAVKNLALSVPDQARQITVIKTTDDYVRAGEVLLTIKEIRKKIEATFKPIKQKMDAAKKEVLDQEKAADAPLAEAEAWLKPQISTYLAEQERIRREEERRLQEEARKREEEARLQAAIEAEKSGNKEEAEAIIEEKPYVAPVVVPRAVPKVSGISEKSNWTFEIVDELLIPRSFMIPDVGKIRGVVKALKNQTNIPGIRVIEERGIAAGRR